MRRARSAAVSSGGSGRAGQYQVPESPSEQRTALWLTLRASEVHGRDAPLRHKAACSRMSYAAGPAEGCQDAVAAAASTPLLCAGHRSSTSDTGVAEYISPTGDTACGRNPCSFPIAQYSKAVTDAFLLPSRPARTPKSWRASTRREATLTWSRRCERSAGAAVPRLPRSFPPVSPAAGPSARHLYSTPR